MNAENKSSTLGIPFYTDAQIGERCAELLGIFDDLKFSYKKKLTTIDISIDEDRLFLAVTAYFHDVARYKWWHYRTEDPVQARLNDSKKAGYLCYWINKIAPAYVLRGSPASTEIDPVSKLPIDVSLLLNAHYAATVATMYFGYQLKDDVMERLVYELQWRDTSAKSCLLIFEILALSRAQSLTHARVLR